MSQSQSLFFTYLLLSPAYQFVFIPLKDKEKNVRRKHTGLSTVLSSRSDLCAALDDTTAFPSCARIAEKSGFYCKETDYMLLNTSSTDILMQFSHLVSFSCYPDPNFCLVLSNLFQEFSGIQTKKNARRVPAQILIHVGISLDMY
jgi:hypothetical protein